MLIRLTSPSGLAVPLEDVKAALRVRSSSDDERLRNLIRAETRRYEDFTGRLMLPGEYEYRVDGWEDPIRVPAVPLRTVTAVAYFASDHVEHVLDPGDWYDVPTDDGFEVRFTDAFSPQSLSSRPHAVRVRFEAGYDDPEASGSGDDPELAPVENDQINIIRMVQRIYDLDELMPDMDIIRTMGNRRIFR